MKKRGFTLAEILISVGIIGIMAALMATAFNHAKPDKTKFLYLKAYDSLNEVVQFMMNNPKIYSPVYTIRTDSGEIKFNVEDYPLLNLNTPTDDDYDTPTDGNKMKFAIILADLFKADSTITNDDDYTFNSGVGNYNWVIKPQGNQLNSSTDAGNVDKGFGYTIQLTIDNKLFRFCVKPNGEIDPIDTVGLTYLKNRKNIRSSNDTTYTPSDLSCVIKYKVTGTTPNFTITDYTPSAPEEEE